LRYTNVLIIIIIIIIISTSELIMAAFHVELIHIISFTHASENRFWIAYFHKKCRRLPGSFAPGFPMDPTRARPHSPILAFRLQIAFCHLCTLLSLK